MKRVPILCCEQWCLDVYGVSLLSSRNVPLPVACRGHSLGTEGRGFESLRPDHLIHGFTSLALANSGIRSGGERLQCLEELVRLAGEQPAWQ
jgi:hypothetical protein